MTFLIILAYMVLIVSTLRMTATLICTYIQNKVSPPLKAMMRHRGEWVVYDPFHWSLSIPFLVSLSFIISTFVGS